MDVPTADRTTSPDRAYTKPGIERSQRAVCAALAVDNSTPPAGRRKLGTCRTAELGRFPVSRIFGFRRGHATDCRSRPAAPWSPSQGRLNGLLLSWVPKFFDRTDSDSGS